MDLPRIVFAGVGFAAARRYIAEALPGVQVEAIDPVAIRASGCAAEILVPTMSRIDGELMDRVRGLRLVQQFGAGLEGVDVAAATERGIAVANVPSEGTGNAESVAEWCVMAAIAVSRRLPQLQRGMRSGGAWGGPQGRALLGRTAGILGLGGIGRALARRLEPFGMRLLALKREPDPALARLLRLEWLGLPGDLPELLRRSDYLFLCLPLNEQTRGLIDEDALALLPDQACIINPARGGLLSERALLAALDRGRLLGAGLDVFEHEPLDPGSALCSRADVLATPHIAGVTDVSYRDIAGRVAENARRLMAGAVLRCCVNASALDEVRPQERRG